MNIRKSTQAKIRRLSLLALLSAIVLLMATTPIGYFKLGAVSITFLAIPVVIGGIVMGPSEGAILGFIFGATSFVQCFGADPLGTALMSINPLYMAIVCFVPRILIGLFSGLTFKFISKHEASNKSSILKSKYILPSFIGSITNSIFFIGLMLTFFYNTPEIQAFGDNLITILSVMFTFNVLIEVNVCLIISVSLSKSFHILTKKYTI